MSEWWSYQPSDFLMFSPQIYWRLFADLNRSLWPLQILLVGVGLVWLAFCARQRGRGAEPWTPVAAAVCAICWALAGWMFLWERFAPINGVASGFAALFAVQAALLAGLAMSGGGWSIARGRRLQAGLALGLWALLGHPLLGLAFGRPWTEAEVFGMAPDPTAIGTFALLMLGRTPNRAQRFGLRLLWPIPVVWCLASASMFWAMGSAQGWLMLAAAVLPAALAARLDGHQQLPPSRPC